MGRLQSIAAKFITSRFEVLAFGVDEREKGKFSTLPTGLGGSRPDLEGREIRTRSFSLDMGMGGMMMGGAMNNDTMAINGQPFDMARIDLEAKLGTIERWKISASSLAHPFHVHGVSFQVVRENGNLPRAENQGWKDTVLINQEAELLVKFEKPAAAIIPSIDRYIPNPG